MKDQLSFQRLDSYQVAKEIAKLVHLAKIRDTELRDQATRASKSCFLQLCEGLPNTTAALFVARRSRPGSPTRRNSFPPAPFLDSVPVAGSRSPVAILRFFFQRVRAGSGWHEASSWGQAWTTPFVRSRGAAGECCATVRARTGELLSIDSSRSSDGELPG